MSQLPTLIADLALILICAGVMTLLFKKLKQPLVLGYVVAGFLASPHMPFTPSVMDTANIKTWADIGVIFLLFALGLAKTCDVGYESWVWCRHPLNIELLRDR